MTQIELLQYIAQVLSTHYNSPDLGNKTDPLDELVFISLCTNTGPKNVDTAFRNLKRRFKGWKELLDAPEGEVAKVIEVAGLAEQREQLLREILKAVLSSNEDSFNLQFLHSMTDSEAYDWLTQLPNVGPKIAHCVMLFSLKRQVLPVDTHVTRIFRRLGLFDPALKPEQITIEIQPKLSEIPVRSLHENLIAHGRKTCRADSPKCRICCIASVCAYAGYHVLASTY
jgi:endonuclease III